MALLILPTFWHRNAAIVQLPGVTTAKYIFLSPTTNEIGGPSLMRLSLRSTTSCFSSNTYHYMRELRGVDSEALMENYYIYSTC